MTSDETDELMKQFEGMSDEELEEACFYPYGRDAAWVCGSDYGTDDGTLWEAGAVYVGRVPDVPGGAETRALDPDEPVVECSRCGQRFAATREATAEAHRDLHFDGDADLPSICAHLPPRRLRLAETMRKSEA
jgi:hypothetical protein